MNRLTEVHETLYGDSHNVVEVHHDDAVIVIVAT